MEVGNLLDLSTQDVRCRHLEIVSLRKLLVLCYLINREVRFGIDRALNLEMITTQAVLIGKGLYRHAVEIQRDCVHTYASDALKIT